MVRVCSDPQQPEAVPEAVQHARASMGLNTQRNVDEQHAVES